MKTQGSSVMASLKGILFIKPIMYSELVFISLNTLANIILAALIVLWLIFHQRYVQNVLGSEHGTPYTNIMIMCQIFSTDGPALVFIFIYEYMVVA